jgi:AcrR family transcriptional regulator
VRSSLKPRQRLSRDESRQQTQQLLRDAALQEFAAHGVAGTSAERIAEAAGFTRGAFYANFANKESLLLDLMRRKMATESPNWVKLADDLPDIETTLRAMDQRAGQFDPDGLWALVRIEIYLCALRDPAVAAQYKQDHESIRSASSLFLARMFERAGKALPAALEDLAEILLAPSMTISLPSPNNSEHRPHPHTTEMLLVVLRCFLTTGRDLSAAEMLAAAAAAAAAVPAKAQEVSAHLG